MVGEDSTTTATRCLCLLPLTKFTSLPHQGRSLIVVGDALSRETFYVAESGTFSDTVVPLTAGNWSTLERSPHLWMVNVCRQS